MIKREINKEENERLLDLYDKYNYLIRDITNYQLVEEVQEKLIKLLNKLERYNNKNTRVIFDGETDPEFSGSLEGYLKSKRYKTTYGKIYKTNKKNKKGNWLYDTKPYQLKLLDGEYIKSQNIVYKKEGDSFKRIDSKRDKTWIPITTMSYQVDSKLIREKIKDSDNETKRKYMFDDVPRYKTITKGTPRESTIKTSFPICEYLFNIEEIVEEIESLYLYILI